MVQALHESCIAATLRPLENRDDTLSIVILKARHFAFLHFYVNESHMHGDILSRPCNTWRKGTGLEDPR
jgi:hypothetical protein